MERDAMHTGRWWLYVTLLILATGGYWQAGSWAAEPQHGVALGATVKYPAGFAHFDYADPKAVKGGTLTLSALGSFDTLNPFTLKGRAPLFVQALVFESLTETSLDEAFTEYGALAESLEMADDGLGIVYHLNPKARFADGQPVTAEDVVFSFAILRSEEATPFYRAYYHDITSVEALDRHTVRVRFARPNRELAMITGQLPILPKHIYAGKDFGRDFLTMALGSGPYTVKDFDIGKTIRYQRNPHYWGKDLNINIGKYNFDEVIVKYYRDQTVRLEALKAAEFDVLDVNSSKQWAVDVAGEKWDKGYIVKEELKHHNTAGMQGFALNLRRPQFQDRRVRHALALALDFPWMNSTLFYNQYTANDSFFANSELAATGLPSPQELALLEPLKAQLPPAVFTTPVETLGKNLPDLRARLRAARQLLQEAGWDVRDGVLVHKASGQPLRFTVTLVQESFQRIVEPYVDALKKLGIQADMKVVDEAVYERLVRAHDFDVIVASFGQSQSPGNEQRDYWHSAFADVEESRNVIGIKNPAVDALVEAIIAASTREELVTATHALDRVLWHEHYMVPQWYTNVHRVTYWNKFSYPQTLPLYFNPLSHLLYWWLDPAREQALRAAMAANRALGK